MLMCLKALIKILKWYRKSSCRKDTAVRQSVKRCEATSAQEEHRHRTGFTLPMERTLKKAKLTSNNKAMPSEDRRFPTIFKFRAHFKKVSKWRQVLSRFGKLSCAKISIFGLLGKDGTKVLCVMLKEHVHKRNVSISSAQNAKLDFPVFSLVDKVLLPVLKNPVKHEDSAAINSSQKYLQRFVPLQKFYRGIH